MSDSASFQGPSRKGCRQLDNNPANDVIPQNGVIGNFTELAENVTLQELAVSNHRRDVSVA